jgi:hypothetical protein
METVAPLRTLSRVPDSQARYERNVMSMLMMKVGLVFALAVPAVALAAPKAMAAVGCCCPWCC